VSSLTFPARRAWRVEPLLLRAAGTAALGASVIAAWWTAIGASDGVYWLELPGGGNPAWIDGPLRGLAGFVGSLPPARLSAALIALSVAYLVALACARTGSISLRAALVAIVAANVAFTLGPSLVSTDVFGYIDYARLLTAHGLNPYVFAPLAAPHDAILPFVFWRHATSPYGPLFTLLSAPLGLVSASAALWTFKAVAGVASVGLAVLVALTARRRDRDGGGGGGGTVNPAAAAIFVGLNPVVLFYAVSGAHNDLLATALVAAGVWFVVAGERRAFAAATVALAAAAIKVTLGLALPFVLIGAHGRRRAIAGAVGAIVLVGAATFAIFGVHVFDQLHRISSDPQFDITFSGPDRLARLLGTGIGGAVRATSVAVALVSALAALVWAWRGGDWITALGWAVLGLIISIASLAPWYLVWLLPFAALGRSRPLRSAALALTAYLLFVHLPAFGGEPWLSGPLPVGR
jgi:hypothetical protein